MIRKKRSSHQSYHFSALQGYGAADANTGLRLSELLGISFDEVDLEKRYICIRHQLSYKRNEEGEYTFAETKNEKSRIIPLNNTAYEILDRNIKKLDNRNQVKIQKNYQ